MSIERQDIDDIAITGVGEPVWFTALVRETAELDRTGVGAAVLSLRLTAEGETSRNATQVRHLLRRLLRPTDRVGQLSPTVFSVLLAPLDSIADTASQIHALTTALSDAGLTASAGFAHRRDSESLLDTWARADAQSDRAAYRAEHHEGLRLDE